jgi:hypothetical protein
MKMTLYISIICDILILVDNCALGVRELAPDFFSGPGFRQSRFAIPTLLQKGEFLAQNYNISPFRINTYKSVSKQMTLTTFRINTYEKTGGGGPY